VITVYISKRMPELVADIRSVHFTSMIYPGFGSPLYKPKEKRAYLNAYAFHTISFL
jgi:hypothetical protein